jgi:hypothetical protein
MSKRKSFLIHIDSLDILDDLTDEQAGQLFKAIKSHQLGEQLELTPIVKIAFSPFKNQFARDDDKYEKLCEKNRLIAEKRYSTKSTTGKTGNHSKPTVTKSTDNKSDSDSDSDSKEPLVPSVTKRSKFKFTDEDLRFAGEMFNRVLVVTPSAKKPNLENWANTIRLMRESDNRDHSTMWAVFDWANRDSFWCSNILSPDKLRKQFDKLQVKKNETNQPRNATTGRKLSAVEENNARLLAKYGNSTAPSERTINPTEHTGMDTHQVSGGVQQQVATHGITIDMDSRNLNDDDQGDSNFRF